MKMKVFVFGLLMVVSMLLGFVSPENNEEINKLQGKIPKELGDCTSLTTLDLRNNKLQGQIPDRITALAQQCLVLSGNNEIHGKIPDLRNISFPSSVQEDFNRRRTLHRISTGPPAPAPGLGGKEAHVNDFIHALLRYNNYSKMVDILVNVTSLATHIGGLVSQGFGLTVLAPSDEAIARLRPDLLSEHMWYYHIIAEYQTETSIYDCVRRDGKYKFDTLYFPHMIAAKETERSIKFGEGVSSGILFDPDIYTDGHISVQGIDGVLVPKEDEISDYGLPHHHLEITVAIKVSGLAILGLLVLLIFKVFIYKNLKSRCSDTLVSSSLTISV